MRSSSSLEKEGMFLVLRIEAKDTVALRAALNAHLRWTNSVLDVLEVLETQSTLDYQAGEKRNHVGSLPSTFKFFLH
jgi:hypothetical protein